MRISDWSSDVCSSDLRRHARRALPCASTHGSEAMADTDEQPNGVGRRQAEDAVRPLLRWAGDDPAREGLLDTHKRVVDAYGDWFSGYADDPSGYRAEARSGGKGRGGKCRYGGMRGR